MLKTTIKPLSPRFSKKRKTLTDISCIPMLSRDTYKQFENYFLMLQEMVSQFTIKQQLCLLNP